MSEQTRPGPPPNPATSEFWQALADGRLAVQRCRACGRYQHYPREICHRCWSAELRWDPVSGHGVVWTWTVVHRPGHEAWAPYAPYGIAVVTLDEGPRILTLWDDVVDRLAIDAAVHVAGAEIDGHAVPVSRASAS
jgi:uncharacterized OB-fold protein